MDAYVWDHRRLISLVELGPHMLSSHYRTNGCPALQWVESGAVIDGNQLARLDSEEKGLSSMNHLKIIDF